MLEETKVLFCCVATQVPMVLEPLKLYNPDEVHLFRYIDPRYAGSHGFNDDCFTEVRDTIRKERPWIHLIIHEERPIYEPVALFNSIFKVSLEVHRRRKDVPICINISSGTPEFALATGWLTMFDRLVNIYSVHSRKYAFDDEALKKYAYQNGHAVGFSTEVGSPRMLVRPAMFELDDGHIEALRQLQAQEAEHRPLDAVNMMHRLKWAGLSDYQPDEGVPDSAKAVAMFYRRNYVNYWLFYGWVERKAKGDGRRDKYYTVTENGMKILEMYRKD